MRLTLRCWTCGLTRSAEAPALPAFAFEVVKAAHGVNWHGVFDLPHSRALVFCTDACLRAAQTTRGTFRLRPPNTPRAAPRETT